MAREWLARTYRDGDEEGILELARAVYPSKEHDPERWRKWWQWMYRQNPAGPAQIWVAEQDGRIVGHRGLVLMMLKVGDRALKVCHSIDVMTHPEYRHQGIHSYLERTGLEEAGKQGVPVAISFPNQMSYGNAIRSGWALVTPMRAVFRPLDWENVLQMRIRSKFLVHLGSACARAVGRIYRPARSNPDNGLSVRQVPFFDQRADDLWARVSQRHPIAVVRNSAHLNWRYVAVPDVTYSIYVAERAGEMSGYVVLRCVAGERARTGLIFDLLADSEEAARFLLRKAAEHCAKEKADFVYGEMIADKAIIASFRGSGFYAVPLKKTSRFCVYSSSLDVSREFLRDPGNWLVQLGDSDAL